MRIIRFILNRPVGSLMLWLGLLLGGIWAGMNMRLDFLPELSIPRLTIVAQYQGLPAGEIRSLLTIPLEDSLSSLGGLRNMKSISRDGLSLIELEFPWGTDRTEAGMRTREVIDLAWHSLPSEAAKPHVLTIDPGDVPIITIAVFPKTGSLQLARRLSDRELRSRLQRIDGVGSIQVSGGLVEEIHIEADSARIANLGYSLPALADVVSNSNIDYPADTITEGTTEYLVKTKSRAEDLETLGKLYLPVGNAGGGTSSVQLNDIAGLSFGTADQHSFFYSGGQNAKTREGVRVQIRRRPGYSPADMVENFKNELPEIQRSFDRDLDIRIISDRSIALTCSMRDLRIALVSGAIFAFLVILLFMRNIRRAAILLVSLPSSLLFAVLFLFLSGKSLNLMSLGGLALGVGMVVDNSIVVIERLARRLNPETGRAERIEIITRTVAELAPSLAGSTATTVIVFTPLLFIRGLFGALFGDLSLSVIFSLSSSLLISLTVIPVLYLLLKPGESGNSGGRLYIFLRKLIRFSLRRPVPVIAAVIICCLSAYLPFRSLRVEVVSPLNEGVLNCSVKMPPGTSIEAVKNLTADIINETGRIRGIGSILAWAGGESSDPYYLASTEESSETIQLRITFPLTEDSERITTELEELLEFQGSTVSIQPPENILEKLIGVNSSRDMVLEGDDPGRLRAAAGSLLSSGIDAHLVPEEEKALINMYPDRQALSSLGIDLPALSHQLSLAVYGSVPTSILIDGREIDVRLRAEDDVRRSRTSLMQLSILNNESIPVIMSSVMEMREESAFPYLLRENRKDLSVIRPAQGAEPSDIEMLKDRGARPKEIPVLNSQASEILMMFALAVLLLYLCLGIQFESFSIPLLLMLSIPPGAAGICAALFLSGGSINLNSCLGILVVMGVSVNNGILLYEESRRLLFRPGALPLSALYRGTSSRLRPILMTSITTVTALIPLAVGPFGNSSQSSLAVSVIGGLTVSTLLSLLLLPLIFRLKLKREQ